MVHFSLHEFILPTFIITELEEKQVMIFYIVRHPSVSKDYGTMLCMEDLEQRLVWLRRPIRE